MRKIITKFHYSDHNFEIKECWHANKRTEERLCKGCKKSIEDEIDFLNNCQMYNEIRLCHFDGALVTYNWLRRVTEFPNQGFQVETKGHINPFCSP